MGEFQDSPCRHIPLPSLRLPSSHPSLTQRIVYVCTRGIVFVVEIFFAPRPVENLFPIGRFLSLGRNFLSGELFHENGPLGSPPCPVPILPHLSSSKIVSHRDFHLTILVVILRRRCCCCCCAPCPTSSSHLPIASFQWIALMQTLPPPCP